MEDGRFDELAKIIGGRAPRRSVVGSLVATAAGGVFGIIGLPGLSDGFTAAAKKKKNSKKKSKKTKKKKQKRRQPTQVACTDAAGCAQPATPCRQATCIANTCGQENLPNGTDCGNGQTCFDGQCGRPCDPSNPSCDRGQQCCKDVCVDTNTSFAHCGKCESPCRAERADRCVIGKCLCGPVNPQCAVGFICANETCVCPANRTTCGSDCVDTDTSFAHCGGCDKACDPDLADTCAGGQCVCGAGLPCGTGFLCQAGECVCPGTVTNCGGECVDLDTSFPNCGGCGDACNPNRADACAAGVCRCGATAACSGGFICDSGSCICPGNLTICGDDCVDTATSLEHCGDCDDSCEPGEADACFAGECVCGAEPRCTEQGQACDNGQCACQTSPGTCRVRPPHLGGWEDAVSPGASVAFVKGPDIPPVGGGSLQLTTGSAATGFASLLNPAYHGLPIADLATLSYATFVESGGDAGDAAPAIELPVQYDVGGDIRLTTLVYEPRNHQGMTALTPGEWQLWNPLGPAGRWWSTQDIAASATSPGVPAGTPVTWSEVLDAIPGAVLDVGMVIALGPNAPNAVGHVDGLNVNDTIYDFEAEPQN